MNYQEIADLTDSTNGIHAINMILDKLVAIVENWAGIKADVIRKPPVVSSRDNYDRLYYGEDAISRSSRYTHYLDNGMMLRTHTTAMIPDEILRTGNDRLIVAPGLVYRRDVMDKTHVGAPHQVDIWLLRRERMTRKNLMQMIEAILSGICPNLEYRCNETIHPYTVNGLEVEIKVGDRWIELLECGEAHPWLLNDNGKSIDRWSGLAMGIGLDRLVMIIKGLDDIRLLRSSNPLVSAQMMDLKPYRNVSKYNASTRDLSLCVSDPDIELIGDRIRQLNPSYEHLIEEISVIASYDYESVPDVAKERLGMLPQQYNLLIRVTIRSIERDITKLEANRIYSEIYANIHEGTKGYTIP